MRIEFRNLSVEYRTKAGPVRALDGAELAFDSRSTVGIVGESGSGKTTLGMAIGRLLPDSSARISGNLLLDETDVFDLSRREVRRLRRDHLGFVFQNPMSALDPTMRIGKQLSDAAGETTLGGNVDQRLRSVGLPDAYRVARSYPHELSGGMAQRVFIAMAIARTPALLIADEPTSALDATVRAEVLALLVGLKDRFNTGLVLLSHELHVVAAHCDEVAVMYAGRVVEHGTARLVFERARHPYTMALIQAAPGRERPGERVQPISGLPPSLREASTGCAFAPRCAFADDRCRSRRPEPRFFDDRTILCHRAEEIASLVANAEMKS
jgi:peptide/nickel transport system ATP-binding protein